MERYKEGRQGRRLSRDQEVALGLSSHDHTPLRLFYQRVLEEFPGFLFPFQDERIEYSRRRGSHSVISRPGFVPFSLTDSDFGALSLISFLFPCVLT